MAKNELVGIAAAAEDEELETWMTLDDDDVLPSLIKPIPPAKRFGHATLVEMALFIRISFVKFLSLQ